MKKIALLSIFILIVLGLYFLTPVRYYLSYEGLKQLQIWIESKGFWAPFVFGVIYVLATVFALPGSVLTITGGLLFGSLLGTVVNWTSATLGAVLSFLISRYLGRGFVDKLLGKQSKLSGLDEKIKAHGFYTIFFLRLVPLFPFNALNFGLGLTKVTFRDYVLATGLGMIPGSFVYTSLGAAGRHIRLSDANTWMDIQVWGPFVLVILLSLIYKLFKKKK